MSNDTTSQSHDGDVSDEELKRKADAGEPLSDEELELLVSHGRCPMCGKLPEAEPGYFECEGTGFHRTPTHSGRDTKREISLVLEAAYDWYDIGGNPAPAKEDGSKAPALDSWTERRKKRNRRDDLPTLFGRATGVGIFLGPAFKSDNTGHEAYGIECFEFDSEAAYDAFLNGAEDAGLDDLVDRIRTGYEERTPSGGVHWFYYCENVEGNTKLAQEPTGEVDERGKPKIKTLIETRGEGGWVVTAPSHGKVHPTGNSYVRTHGRPRTIPTITIDERASLFAYARTFDRMPENAPTKSARQTQSFSRASRRTQALFNKHASWDDVLVPHGWQHVGGSNDWRRPGAETNGIDATTDADGTDRLWVHSTSTALETGHYFTKFQAYAVLNHAGDHAAAEADLKATWDPDTGFREVSATIDSGQLKDDRAVVRLDVDNVNTIGDRIVDTLQMRNDPPSLFVDANAEMVGVRIQNDGTPVIDHFTDHQARERIMRPIKFESPGKVTKDDPQPEPVERTVSLDVVRNVQGRRNLPFPPLDTITTAPSFAADGTIRLTAGYDPATRAYLYPVGGVDFHTPSLDRNPTQADIRWAVDLLDELIGDFPFVGDADRAHTMVGILQQAAPDLIGGFIPMLAFEKPAPGTGASLLVRTITTPFTGPNGAGSITHPKDDAEFEKTLVGLHMQGLRHAFFDNVDGLFGGPLLAEALTATHKNLRVLGTNRILQARMPTFWYLTGNNPTFTDDLPRRIVPIRLDAKIDRPWQRSGFRHRLPAWAWSNRVMIIQAVLTIWKAWLVAGRPKGTVTMGSYEPWAETMGGVLDVAGIPGFLTNTDDFYDSADVEGSAWRAIVAAWWEQFGSEPVTVKDLLMLPAVSEMLGIGMSDRDRKAFGWKIRAQRDRRYGDLVISQKGMNRDKVQTYHLIHREGTIRARKKDDARTPFGKPGDVIDLFGARP